MVNKSYNSKLDGVIKQTLSDYEAPNDTSGWAQMERLLDAAPKSKLFRYKRKLSSIVESLKTIPKSKSVKWVFSTYFLIGLIVVCGAYLLYNILNSSKTPENTTNSIPQNGFENPINTETLKTTTPPGIPQDALKAEKDIHLAKDTIDNLIPASDKNSVKPTETAIVEKEKILQKETKLAEKTAKNNAENVKTDYKKSLEKLEEIMKKVNPSAIIDTRDSSIGRNNFLLYNIYSDSSKKNQNQEAPRDSLKGP